jgi:CRISPR system Cascade subunit CasE
LAFEIDLVDSYAWHKKSWDCFPGDPDGKRDFLIRLDSIGKAFHLWVLSAKKPICPAWCAPEMFVVKEIAPSFLEHRFYCFDLRANPTKRVAQGAMQGKRVALFKPDDLRAWLDRKGQMGGFRIVEEKPLEIGPMAKGFFRKEYKEDQRECQGVHGGVQFRGVLEVTDVEIFKKLYHQGVGSGKAFGYGLLLLAPTSL